MTRDDAPELTALRELHRVMLLVNSEQKLADVLETAAQGVVDVIGFQAVVVNMLTSRGDFEVVTALGPPRETLLGARIEREVFEKELAVADVWGLLYFVPEGRLDTAFTPGTFWRTTEPPLDVADAWQPDDALYAPLNTPAGELLGILSVDLPQDGLRPGAAQLEILEMYAVQIGLAISHARERELLGERLRLATATRRILQTASTSGGLDDVLEACVAPLQDGYLGERAWIRLFADPGGAWGAVNYPEHLRDDLNAAAAADLPSSLVPLDTELVLATGERVARACWETKRTITVSTDGHDTSHPLLSRRSRLRVLEWLAAVGHEQFVLVPVGAAEQCLGYLALNRLGGLDWTRAEELAALDVGRELGRVIGIARLRAREHELMARLEELDDYKSRVVTTIIHELKNPLAVVMGNLELAGDAPELTAKAHAAIARGAERMQALVEDLLTLTRLREPVVELDRTTVDLSEIVLDVVALIADQAELTGIALDLSAVQPGVTVRGERSEMDRLVLNLASNAIKYSAAGDTVSLTLAQRSQDVELCCVDTGLGISPADMHSIFDEFDRSSNPEARAKPGSGLGLAIVRKIVQRHQGSIDVTSQPGRGSRFVVRIPSS